MAFYVSDNGKDFTPAPEGLHPGVCVDVVDKGMVTGKWGAKPKCQLRWQIEERDPETGKRFLVVSQYTSSLNEKATLRAVLESWRGRKFTPEELKKFDLETLIGANCQIQIVHNLGDNGKTYANVQAVVRAAKGAPPVEAEDYVRDKDRAGKDPIGASSNDDEDDPVPF
jgi:hypothetical protein